MSISAFYTPNGKFYKTPHGVTVSVGRVIQALTGETFDHVPLHKLIMAEMEGTGAHRIACDLALKTMGHLDDVPMPPMPPDYPGDKDQWESAMLKSCADLIEFYREWKVRPVAVEEVSWSVYGMCGQPDIKAWVTPPAHTFDILATLDYKRVAEVTESHRLKLLAYLMLDGYKDSQKAYVVWLKKTGGYKLIEVKKNAGDEAAIIGQATVLRWQMQKGILKP